MSALTVFSTDQAPISKRAAYWGDIVWRSFGRLRSDAYGDERFRGEVVQVDLGGLRVCRLQAARHRVVRTAGGGLSDPGYLKMVVQHRGHSVFEQNGRRARLAPGCWSVYDTTRSYTVSNPEEVEQHVLLLPRDAVLHGRRELENLLVRQLPAATGVSRLACETIRLALEEVDRALPVLRADLGEMILRMIHLALLEQLGVQERPSPRWVMRERIKAHVERRLSDHNLGIESVAQALNCSKRTLHKAFEDECRTLDQYIWERRLEAARQGLEDGGAAGRTISEVAFACGFHSAAHFSRAFRARFGASPREWRERRSASSRDGTR